MTQKTGKLAELNVQPGDVVLSGSCHYVVQHLGLANPYGDIDVWAKNDLGWVRGADFENVISRAKTATPSHIVTLPCGKAFDLTNPYGTPYGLLDEVYGAGAADAMKAHGGPYEWWDGYEWWDSCSWHSARDCENENTEVYRVKPAPVVETITQTMWQDTDGMILICATEQSKRVTITFTRTNGVIDNDSYKVEVKG